MSTGNPGSFPKRSIRSPQRCQVAFMFTSYRPRRPLLWHAELAVIARALGGACSSAGMVFAIHHAQALSLAHHAHEGQIARLTSRIAADESLLASATTEITTGGDVRSSTCAVISDGDRSFWKRTPPSFPVRPSRARSLREKQAARPVAVDHQRGVAAREPKAFPIVWYTNAGVCQAQEERSGVGGPGPPGPGSHHGNLRQLSRPQRRSSGRRPGPEDPRLGRFRAKTPWAERSSRSP
jgi:hypothetical protein